MPPVDEQMRLLFRGVEYGDRQLQAAMEKELRERLAEGKPLRVYCGYDPTNVDLTLGHTLTMRKLRHFQQMGHQVVFLIGTYTALVGDPSDRNTSRPMLTPEQVRENAATYAEQAFRILDREKTEVRENGEWLADLTLRDLINLASNFTISQFLARESFQKRLERQDPIFLHELFYPLMQGYDAVALETDVQVGGTDQLFNLMAGRELQRVFEQRPLVPVTVPILLGTDGATKMSKSAGNYIAVAEPPEDKFGKTMRLPDDAMWNWFELLTDVPQEEIDDLRQAVERGANPMDAKKRLAWEIVREFDGEEAADAARAHFESTVQRREIPDDIPELSVGQGREIDLVQVLKREGLVPTGQEIKRLIAAGAVELDGGRVSEQRIPVRPGQILRAGKRRWLRFVE